MNRAWWRILLVILLVAGLAGAFVSGLYLGYSNQLAINKIDELINKEEGQPATVDFAPFWRAWGVIDEKYVNGNAATTTSSSTTTNSSTAATEKRVWGAITGLVDSLDDPYSVFLPPTEKKSFEEEIQGNFGGVGIELGVRDRALHVISALPETPAMRAGMKSGDVIMAINDESTATLDIGKAIARIRGEVGTKVKLTIKREGEKEDIDFNLTRAVINIPTIETEMLPGRVFVIRLFNFGATSQDLFRQALREFAQAKTDKLIIDLRGNPGGYLEAAVGIASWFLPVDKTVAIESRSSGEEPKIYKSRGYNVFTGDLKLVILVDRGSASASEILAGALSEHGKATLVGEKTFGKGSVQELIPITNDTSLKITVARWLTPKGISISHEGLTPTVLVKVDEEAEEEQTGINDPFVKKAIEVLK